MTRDTPEADVFWHKDWFTVMPKPDPEYKALIQLIVPEPKPGSPPLFGKPPGTVLVVELITSFDNLHWWAWVRGVNCFIVACLDRGDDLESDDYDCDGDVFDHDNESDT